MDPNDSGAAARLAVRLAGSFLLKVGFQLLLQRCESGVLVLLKPLGHQRRSLPDPPSCQITGIELGAPGDLHPARWVLPEPISPDNRSYHATLADLDLQAFRCQALSS
jgi:hypothetical protein